MNRWKNPRRVILLFAVVAVASAGLGFAGSALIKSPADVTAAKAPPKPTVLTAEVKQGPITDTLVISGKVALGNSIGLTPKPPLDALQPVVTKTPVSLGASFGPGAVVIEISDRPVIVIPSPIPMLRDLGPGMSGEDVDRFQQALKAVGLSVEDKAGNFGESTIAALKKLYRNDGYTAPEQGGQVIASQSEIQLIPIGEKGQVVGLPFGPGSAVTSAAITVSTLPPQISATVNPADASRLTPGMGVTVTVEGKPYDGLIASVGAPAQDATNGGFSAPISISLKTDVPSEAIGVTAQAPINLSRDPTAGLKVPLSAIYSTSGGGTAVIVVKGRTQKEVAVTVAGSGDGFARINDASHTLAVGDRVRVGVSK